MRFKRANKATKTSVGIGLVFVTSVCRQNDENCYQHCSSVFDSSVKTATWGLLSVLSWFVFCFTSVCTSAWNKVCGVRQVQTNTQTNNSIQIKKKPSNISISYRRGVEVSSAECESEVLGIESQQNRAGYFGPDRLLHRAETVVGPAGRLKSNSQALSSLWMPLGVPLVI